MKKILNNPLDYANETLEGLCAAHPRYYKRIGAEGRVIVRPDAPIKGKVGIVTGGGSGHLPVFTGYLGPGLLDACAIGDVFASPGVDLMADAIRAANGGAGVLRLYGNYGGDNMNFDMAGEILEMEDVRTTTVRVADDVASAGPQERSKRRGIAGMVYCFKIAGAKADTMADLDSVTATAQKAADACRTAGVALTPCTVPAAGRPTFTIAEDEMEIGMGIHGEPGVRRGVLRTADETAEEMLGMLLADMPLTLRRPRVGALPTAWAPRRSRSCTSSTATSNGGSGDSEWPSWLRSSAATRPRWRWRECRSHSASWTRNWRNCYWLPVIVLF